MNRFLIALFVLFTAISLSAQGFKVSAKGDQTFNFEDKGGRNQATFFSRTLLEDITGTSNNIKGKVLFSVDNIESTLTGKISITTESIKTGISLRDEHLQGEAWLDAKKFSEISFDIKKVNKIVKSEGNKLVLNVTGDFFLKGKTKSVTSDFTLIYLDASEKTKTRAEGDLLNVRGKFNIKLSDFGIESKVIGAKVADDIEIEVNIVGSNK